MKSDFANEAHARAGFPTRGMTFIGVTGTNGKSTVADALCFLLNHLGKAMGLFGTVEYRFANTTWPATHTTPDLLGFLRVLHEMKKEGAEGAVLEVSSHALHQERLAGTHFHGAIFTNLTQDHLDYHHSFEDYFSAKEKLFQPLWLDANGFAVLNEDDPYGRRLAQAAFPPQKLTYGTSHHPAAFFAKAYQCTQTGITAELDTPVGTKHLQSPLVGVHNLSNLLAVAAAAFAMGFDLDAILSILATYPGLRGRLERVTKKENPFSIFVDYAHTPDALHCVLKALRPLVSAPGKLWVVFGCGGDRDRTKRPLMGKEAALWADRVYLTSDNPRSEDPRAIVDEIWQGIPSEAMDRVTIEVDRAKAIALCVGRLEPKDILLVAGKGHETYQVIGDQTIAFDDAEVVRRCLN